MECGKAYLFGPKCSYDEYRARNNSLPRGGEKVHDSRNRGERVLMHRSHGNAIDDLLFYNLARDSGRRRVIHTSMIVSFSPSNCRLS